MRSIAQFILRRTLGQVSELIRISQLAEKRWPVERSQRDGSKAPGSKGNIELVEQLSEERGSAIAEFVLMALPLLLPATLFFLAMSQSATVNMNTSLMARQAVTAFATGEDDRQAHARVQTLIDEYKRIDPAILSVDYRVTCQTYPCITPGSAVELLISVQFRTVKIGNTSGEIASVNSRSYASEQRAVGFVDKWK